MQLNVEKPKQFKSWLKSNKMSSKKFAKISGIKQQALKKATKKKSLPKIIGLTCSTIDLEKKTKSLKKSNNSNKKLLNKLKSVKKDNAKLSKVAKKAKSSNKNSTKKLASKLKSVKKDNAKLSKVAKKAKSIKKQNSKLKNNNKALKAKLKKSTKLGAKKTSKTKAKAKKTVTTKAPVKKNNIALNKDDTGTKSNIKEQSGSTEPRKIEVNIDNN
jgi:gamma-glutamylcysteine synthetase